LGRASYERNFQARLGQEIVEVIRFKLRERIADMEFTEGRRITLMEVADRTGIGRITLSRMVQRRVSPRTDTIDRLCGFFDCRVEDLMEYVPVPPRRTET